MSWIAEDVPWYMIDKSVRGPRTDEDAGMSAPVRLGEYATEQEARQAVAGHLEEISTFNFIVRGGERELFLNAAQTILQGAYGIRIHGRYHTVREG